MSTTTSRCGKSRLQISDACRQREVQKLVHDELSRLRTIIQGVVAADLYVPRWMGAHLTYLEICLYFSALTGASSFLRHFCALTGTPSSLPTKAQRKGRGNLSAREVAQHQRSLSQG
jgi:hypothetical protein